MPVAVFAEAAAAPQAALTQSHHWADTPNEAGFYIDLPAVNPTKLVGQIRTYRVSLMHREAQITQYLDEHRLDAKDAFITVIMPGGLLYALVRKGNLTRVRAQRDEISEEIEELGRDLLAMQAQAGDLTVAQLQ
jgi:hypothetical protein